MKNLIDNYVKSLTINKLKEFSLKNGINLTDKELNYLLNLVKENCNEILLDDTKYLKEVENNISPTEFIKIKELYLYYKNRYKGYLF